MSDSSTSPSSTPIPPVVQTLLDDAVRAGRLLESSASNLSRWLSEPQYAPYRDQLQDLIQRQDFDELNRLFWERIPFGTGGRRGPMSELGTATINDRTIAESAHGLAVYVQKWLREHSHSSNKEPRAAVAFDSRHRSSEFARRTACVLAAHGFRVYFFPEPRATPELSFTVRCLKCDTGVVISASHNPPCDNGFKAYWSTGGQVLPPHDAGIIACVDAATDIPTCDFEDAVAAGRIVLLTDRSNSGLKTSPPTRLQSPAEPNAINMDEAYIETVAALSLSSAREVDALYTPLHGVGESSVYRVLQKSGFEKVAIFEPQRRPDGAFPNVPDHLPNPERHDVFGPAIAHALETFTDIILGSDPDADRMAVAVRDRQGGFTCLTGNQLSALLTDYVLSHRAAQQTLSPDHFIIETLVTTPLVAAIGRAYGVKVINDVLVGFKHIAREIDVHGPDKFVFATEESIGFMAGDYARDKDAAVGALFALELAAELRQRGLTLLDHLDELYRRHGVHADQTLSVMSPGPTGNSRIDQIMQTFRTSPPSTLGACVWERVRDYKQNEIRSLPSNHRLKELPQPVSNLLIFEGRITASRFDSPSTPQAMTSRSSDPETSQGTDCEIILAMRPSGTEPKIKFYCFAKTIAEPSLTAAQSRATTALSNTMAALQQWLNPIISGTNPS